VMKWVACKERESQRWFIAGQPEWYTQEYYKESWSRRASKRRVQKSYVIPRPEHVSPFVECHQIIEANTREDAECLISSWT